MADVIYKYGPIDPGMDFLTVKGQPLYVGIHIDDKIYVWCRNRTENEDRETVVRLVATGESYAGPYIGTVITRSGFVWHCIEVY